MKARGTDKFSDWFFGSFPGIFSVLYKAYTRSLDTGAKLRREPGKMFREAHLHQNPPDSQEHLLGFLCPECCHIKRRPTGKSTLNREGYSTLFKQLHSL